MQSTYKTRYIQIVDPQAPDPHIIEEAAAVIRSGELLAFPTDTVYGLGASFRDEEALAAIFTVKGRPQESPLLVHVGSQEQLREVVSHIPESAKALMDRFWPGPLALILPSQDFLSVRLKGTVGGVGIRMPANQVAIDLLLAAGPIAAPSANLHGRPSPTTAEHVRQDLDGKIAAILDGGPTQAGIESTLIDLTQDPIRILRQGAVPNEEIRQSLHFDISRPMPRQDPYQLSYQTRLARDEVDFNWQKEELHRLGKPFGILSWNEEELDPRASWQSYLDVTSGGNSWFSLLREAEQKKIKVLLIRPLPKEAKYWSEALRNRIDRTVGGK